MGRTIKKREKVESQQLFHLEILTCFISKCKAEHGASSVTEDAVSGYGLIKELYDICVVAP